MNTVMYRRGFISMEMTYESLRNMYPESYIELINEGSWDTIKDDLSRMHQEIDSKDIANKIIECTSVRHFVATVKDIINKLHLTHSNPTIERYNDEHLVVCDNHVFRELYMIFTSVVVNVSQYEIHKWLSPLKDFTEYHSLMHNDTSYTTASVRSKFDILNAWHLVLSLAAFFNECHDECLCIPECDLCKLVNNGASRAFASILVTRLRYRNHERDISRLLEGTDNAPQMTIAGGIILESRENYNCLYALGNLLSCEYAYVGSYNKTLTANTNDISQELFESSPGKSVCVDTLSENHNQRTLVIEKRWNIDERHDTSAYVVYDPLICKNANVISTVYSIDDLRKVLSDDRLFIGIFKGGSVWRTYLRYRWAIRFIIGISVLVLMIIIIVIYNATSSTESSQELPKESFTPNSKGTAYGTNRNRTPLTSHRRYTYR